jgi:signal transduction histidine kinase
LRLKADPTFVGMIAQNLVENAVKYNNPGGRIRVEARAVNGEVEMTIGNTGDGIPKSASACYSNAFIGSAEANECRDTGWA